MDTLEARRILNLPETGWLDDGMIKTAYRAAARAAHPDAGGNTADAARVNEARAVLSTPEGMVPPAASQPFMKRRLGPADFGSFQPRVTDTTVDAVAGVVREVDDLLADLTGAAPPGPTVAEAARADFVSERGVFHDTGWSTDQDDAGLPYLVVSGIPVGARLVVRAAGDRITLLGDDGSTLTIDFAGQSQYRPGS